MIKGKRIIALILARGGSERLPGKNIKKLLGKPLISWTIEQAKKSKYIDKLIVSTDDKRIANISKRYGAEIPFLRPKKLAGSESPTIDAVFHALDWFEIRNEYYDILILLEPTSPLRKKCDIDKAVKLFLKNFNTHDSLVSVGEVHLEDPRIMKKIQNRYVASFLETKEVSSQKKKKSNVYFPYGVIYLSKVSSLRKYRTFYQKRTIPYFIERWQNYEVDDIFDFVCIQEILRRMRK